MPQEREPHGSRDPARDRCGPQLDSDAGRANSLHKLDTLVSALQAFRSGLVEEFEQYDRRERGLEKLTKAAKRGSRKKTAGRR